MRRRLVGLTLILLLAGCGGGTATPNAEATKTRQAELDELATARATPVAVVAQLTATVAPTPKPPTPTPRLQPTPTSRPPTPTPTPKPQPTPTMTADQAKALYRRDLDVRALYANLNEYKGWKLYYEGSVLTVHSNDTAALIQVQVRWPGGSTLDTKVVDVVIDKQQAVGIYEKDNVAVWGILRDWYTITNAYGGKVDQPLLDGDYIQKL